MADVAESEAGFREDHRHCSEVPKKTETNGRQRARETEKGKTKYERDTSRF